MEEDPSDEKLRTVEKRFELALFQTQTQMVAINDSVQGNSERGSVLGGKKSNRREETDQA